MEKTYTVVPRGSRWSSAATRSRPGTPTPGCSRRLATGNAVVVKPHPAAILPLAITVAIAREVLAEAGFARDLVTLVGRGAPGGRVAAELAIRPEVRVVDFTGSTAFGEWLEDNARQARGLHREGRRQHGRPRLHRRLRRACCRNLAFSLSLYSGQMCTTPQDLLVPRGRDRHRRRAARRSTSWPPTCGAAIDRLLGEDAQAVELLGAIVNDDVLSPGGRRGCARRGGGGVARGHAPGLPRRPGPHAGGRAGVGRGPEACGSECFGPVAFLVTTDSTDVEPGALPAHGGRPRRADRGGLLHRREGGRSGRGRRRWRPGVALSENLTGGVYVNQSRGVLGLPRDRRQPGGERGVHRRRTSSPAGSGWCSPAGTCRARPPGGLWPGCRPRCAAGCAACCSAGAARRGLRTAKTTLAAVLSFALAERSTPARRRCSRR